MEAVDVNKWIEDAKAGPGSAGIGMMLAHHGVVRGTSRSGEPVRGMILSVDQRRFDKALAEAETWTGIVAVRAWVNEGELAVGDDIMKVLVAGDIRENVFGALQRLVRTIKDDVLTESELR